MKRAVQEKMKEFSKELHRINKQRQAQTGAKTQPKPPNARAKALEFAKNVPKPKAESKGPVIIVDGKLTHGAESLRGTTGNSTSAAETEKMAGTNDCEEEEELQRRERKRFEDV